MLELLPLFLVERFEVEGILRREVLVVEETANMATKMLLVLDDFIEGDLVLDEKGNLDVELVDVLLSKLVLSHVLDNGLS